MLTRRMLPRPVQIARGSIISCLSIALLATPVSRTVAQAAVDATSTDWRAWAFVHVGPALTSHVNTQGYGSGIFASLSGGLAASCGAILGMVRATDNERFTLNGSPGAGMRDEAVLAGARSRGDRLFFAGAAGIARATPVDVFNINGTPDVTRQFAPAFDLSAHACYRVAGLSVAVSGILGPSSTRYFAVSFGAELGWLGF